MLAMHLAACSPAEDVNLDRVWGAVQLSVDRMDFPATLVGLPLQVTAQVSNNGNGDVRAQIGVDGHADVVLLSAAHLRLAPGQSASVVVELLAQSPGSVQARLVVDHDGVTPQRVELPVTGQVDMPDCDDGNICTLDVFDSQAPGLCQHLPQAGPCSDDNLCTRADQCLGGQCVGTPTVCDDGVACTQDTCNPGTGACEFSPLSARCNDADPCTSDVCQPGPGADLSGCVHALAPTGTPCGPSGCGTVALCAAGACVDYATPEGYPCEDGDPCSQQDSCHGGVCVPGQGGHLALGDPMVVSVDGFADRLALEPPSPGAPLWGQWPVRVDGVAMVPTFDREAYARIIWRGTDRRGETCAQPGACTTTPPRPCERVGVVGLLQLNASNVALLNGAAEPQQTADLAELHQRLRAQENAVLPDAQPPQATVASVATVMQPDGTGHVAAVVRFADACGGCGGDDAPFVGPGDGAAQCLNAGAALAVYRVDDAGFHLKLARWLGFEMPNAGAGLVEGQDGMPLLGLSIHQGQLTVAWATQAMTACPFTLCDGPGCDCNPAMEVWALSISSISDPNAEPDAVETFRVELPVNAGERTLADFSLHHANDADSVTWRQPAQWPNGGPENCSWLPAPVPMELVELVLGPGQTPQLLAGMASWGARVVDAQGPSVAVWQGSGIVEDGMCSRDDVVRLLAPNAQTELLRAGPSDTGSAPNAPLQRVSVEVQQGRAMALGITARGSLMVGVGTSGGTSPTQTEAQFSAPSVLFSSGSAAHAAMDNTQGLVVAVATLQDNQGVVASYATGLSVTSLSCGPVLTW